MQASLTIVRYPKIFIPFAFFAMAIHRLPLWRNKQISFYKLLGCGKNGSFDKIPDLQQWAVLAVCPGDFSSDILTGKSSKAHIKALYGRFIGNWFHFFNCETFTILLSPAEGHGLWDGKKVFGNFDKKVKQEGVMATLTRATIRLKKLPYFWRNVAGVTAKMHEAKGFITSVGIGEVPWIKQATFSVWDSQEEMKAFAYGMKEHTEVIKQTRQQNWYSEEMFVRFNIIGCCGTLNGINPLEGKLL